MRQATISKTTQRNRGQQSATRHRDESDKRNKNERARPFAPEKREGGTARTTGRSQRQRQTLIALQARLQGNVMQTADDALSNEGIEKTCASPDTADMACEIVEQDVALNLLGNASDTLEQIDAALQRLDEGIYGECAECGTKIPAERLEAIPYTVHCVQCASRLEHAR